MHGKDCFHASFMQMAPMERTRLFRISHVPSVCLSVQYRNRNTLCSIADVQFSSQYNAIARLSFQAVHTEYFLLKVQFVYGGKS